MTQTAKPQTQLQPWFTSSCQLQIGQHIGADNVGECPTLTERGLQESGRQGMEPGYDKAPTGAS